MKDESRSSEVQASSLYEAAVSSLVSERTANETWEKVALFIHNLSGGVPIEELGAQFSLVEQQIKADYSITKLPSAWRSAKATALKAVANEVPLTDGGGKVLGKTAVSNACKGERTKPSTYETAWIGINNATHALQPRSVNSTEHRVLLQNAEALVSKLRGLELA